EVAADHERGARRLRAAAAHVEPGAREDVEGAGRLEDLARLEDVDRRRADRRVELDRREGAARAGGALDRDAPGDRLPEEDRRGRVRRERAGVVEGEAVRADARADEGQRRRPEEE